MSLPCHTTLHFTTIKSVHYVTGDNFGVRRVDNTGFGEYADILWCKGADNDHQITIVKKLRVPHANTDEIKNVLRASLATHFAISETLTHDYIVPFQRFYLDSATNLPAISISFFPDGNIVAYLKRQATATDYDLLRIRLIKEALDGVNFLHRNDLVHGNLRGSNILVTTEGHAAVSDFGVNALIRSTSQFSPLPESLNWMPRELFIPTSPDHTIRPTKESDVYSFARTIEEICTLRVPFSYIKPKNRARFFIKLEKVLLEDPKRIPEVPSAMWGILQACFAVRPQDRPTCKILLDQLQEL